MKKKKSKFEQLKFNSKKKKYIDKFNFTYKLDSKVILDCIIIIFLIIIVCISMIKIYSIVNNSDKEKEEGLISYSVCGNDNKCSTNININKLENINKIKLLYFYNYQSSMYKKYNMSYWIDSSILIENESKELFGDTSKLINKKSTIFVSKNISINRELSIYLHDYYKIIEDYKKKNNINNCTSNISFTFYIKNNGIISKISSLDLFVDNDLNVSISSNNLKNDALTNDQNNNNYIILISFISIISIILAFVLIIQITNYILNNIEYYRRYNNRIRKIIKENKENIILGNIYNSNKKYINVTSFDKLLEYKKKTKNKIKIYNVNNKCIFTIEIKNKLYRYILR